MVDLLVKSMKNVAGGTVKIDLDNEATARIDIDKDNKINIDLIQPKLFRTEDETGLFDKLVTAKEFAQKLTDNGLTLSFKRKGKEAIILGKEAKPTLSKIVTRTDDIQVNSVKQSVKLKRDMKVD
jgi:hypothetical protein